MFPLPETITVWNRAANDGLGGGSWSGPFTYAARIAYSQRRFTDSNGDEKISTVVCYSEGAGLRLNSMVLFAESSAINPPAEARVVKAISETPSGGGPIKKAWFS